MAGNRTRGAISAAFTKKRGSIKRAARASEAWVEALNPKGTTKLTRSGRITGAVLQAVTNWSMRGPKAFLDAEAAGSRIRQRDSPQGREDMEAERVKKRITLPKVRGYWGDE